MSMNGENGEMARAATMRDAAASESPFTRRKPKRSCGGVSVYCLNMELKYSRVFSGGFGGNCPSIGEFSDLFIIGDSFVE